MSPSQGHTSSPATDAVDDAAASAADAAATDATGGARPIEGSGLSVGSGRSRVRSGGASRVDGDGDGDGGTTLPDVDDASTGYGGGDSEPPVLMPNANLASAAYDPMWHALLVKMGPFLPYFNLALSPLPPPWWASAVLASEACPFCLKGYGVEYSPLVLLTCKQHGCWHAAHVECLAAPFWVTNLHVSHPPLATCARPAMVPRPLATHPIRTEGLPLGVHGRCYFELSFQHVLSDTRFQHMQVHDTPCYNASDLSAAKAAVAARIRRSGGGGGGGGGSAAAGMAAGIADDLPGTSVLRLDGDSLLMSSDAAAEAGGVNVLAVNHGRVVCACYSYATGMRWTHAASFDMTYIADDIATYTQQYPDHGTGAAAAAATAAAPGGAVGVGTGPVGGALSRSGGGASVVSRSSGGGRSSVGERGVGTLTPVDGPAGRPNSARGSGPSPAGASGASSDSGGAEAGSRRSAGSIGDNRSARSSQDKAASGSGGHALGLPAVRGTESPAFAAAVRDMALELVFVDPSSGNRLELTLCPVLGDGGDAAAMGVDTQPQGSATADGGVTGGGDTRSLADLNDDPRFKLVSVQYTIAPTAPSPLPSPAINLSEWLC